MSTKLILAAAVIALSSIAAGAQSNSSNPTMAPAAGGATKSEAPGAQPTGAAKQPSTAQSSSNPTMAPAGGAAKTEAPGAQTSGHTKQPDPSQSSSTPTMAPTK